MAYDINVKKTYKQLMYYDASFKYEICQGEKKRRVYTHIYDFILRLSRPILNQRNMNVRSPSFIKRYVYIYSYIFML